MHIQILGPGCKRCVDVADNVKTALAELGREALVEKVTDIREIMKFSVMSTPGLVIDGEVKVAGRVPPVAEVKSLLALVRPQ